MKQCPQCKKIYDDAALFCEEDGTKLVVLAENGPQTGADSGRTVAANSDKTVYGEQNHHAGQDSRTQYAGYGQNYGGQPRGGAQPNNGGRLQSHVGQSGGRDYSDSRNYGPRNYGGQQPGRNGGGQRPVAPRQRKPRKPIKISKKIWIALAELVLLIALVLVFNAVGNSKTDPVDSATAYFNAMVEGDYDTIASLTDLPDGPFLTEEAFKMACEEWTPLSYEGKVTKVSASEQKGGSYYGGYDDYYGYGGESSSSAGLSDYVKTVEVEYMLSGDPNVYSYNMQLISGEEKVMFFFNKWEVANCTPFLAEDFSITVPTGATLVVDGYVVDEEYLQPSEDDYTTGDIYMLDLFVGNHTITVLVDGFDAMNAEYYVSESYDYVNYCYDDNFEVSEETQNAVVAQAKTLVEQIYTAALKKDDAEAALAGFSGAALESMTEQYNSLVEDLHWDEDRTMTKITLKEFEPYSCYVVVSDGVLYLYLELDYAGTFEYTYRDGATKKTDSYDDSYLELSAYYQYLDGVWTPTEYRYFSY